MSEAEGWCAAAIEQQRLKQIAEARATVAEAREAKLIALVKELADDLEAEVCYRWGYDDRLARQLERDMDVVVRARAAIEETSRG